LLLRYNYLASHSEEACRLAVRYYFLPIVL
jgi:hypothetical protein